MSQTSVFCVAISHFQADEILTRLKAAKFSNRDISVLFADEGYASWSRRAATAEMRWLAEIGAMPLPEAGPFMAAGPIMAVISGAGGYAGAGVADALVTLGLGEMQALRLEGRIRNEGNILIVIHTSNPRQSAQAKAIFSNAGAQDLCCAVQLPAACAS